MPDRPEQPGRQISAQDARQGRAPGVVRYVLAWSLILSVVGLVVVFLAVP